MADRGPALSVVIHDVAPPTLAACRRLVDRLGDFGPLPLTLLTVPRYHGVAADRALVRWLDEQVARGHELALHGYHHRDRGRPRGVVDWLRRRCYTAGEGEFCALTATAATRRVAAGRRWFAAHGWPLEGFVAPAWLMGPAVPAVLAAQGFAYTATLGRLIELPSQRSHVAPALVWSSRAAWRRACSVGWNAVQARRHRRHPLLRFELHPADADFGLLRESWMDLLETALDDGREALTLNQAVRRLAILA